MKVDEIRNVDKLLLAGIAKPEPFFKYLQSEKGKLANRKAVKQTNTDL